MILLQSVRDPCYGASRFKVKIFFRETHLFAQKNMIFASKC